MIASTIQTMPLRSQMRISSTPILSIYFRPGNAAARLPVGEDGFTGFSAGAGSAAAAGGSDGEDKAALVARAKELGIDAKGNWGVPKLQAAIADAEKAAAGAGNPGGEG